MRWLWLALTVCSFLICFTRHRAGSWGFWLLLGLVGVFATALAFVQSRISDNARAESLSSYDLQQLREGKQPLDRR